MNRGNQARNFRGGPGGQETLPFHSKEQSCPSRKEMHSFHLEIKLFDIIVNARWVAVNGLRVITV